MPDPERSGLRGPARPGFLACLMSQSYIALIAAGALAAGCRSGTVAPRGTFAPATREAFEQMAARTAPRAREILRLTWRSDDGRISLSGSGAVRIQPPDSLRLDMAVRLGVGRGTVLLTGEDVDAEPADLIAAVLPDRSALWAVLGVVRTPHDLVSVELLRDGRYEFWRLSDSRGRITTLEMEGDLLRGVVREEGGRTTVRLRLGRDAAGRLVRGSVTDAVRGARFEFEVRDREQSGPFDRDIWQIRR